MRWFAIQRRLFAALSITVLAGGVALLSGSAASAAPTNASNFGLSMVARLELGPPPVPPGFRVGVTLVPRVPLTGTVDGAGNLQTSTGVSLGSSTAPLDRQADSLLDQPLDEVRLFAPNGFTGTIDPAAGTIDLAGSAVTFTFAGTDSGHPYECTTNLPGDGVLHLHASDYNAGSGTGTLEADTSFGLMAFGTGIPECENHDGYFNSIYPLPTAADNAVFSVAIAFNPAITAATPTGPATAPQTAAPSAGGGGSVVAGGGGTPVAAGGKFVLPAGTLRRVSPKTAAPKAAAATKAPAGGKTTTPTTAYVWKGGSNDVSVGQFDDQVTPPGAVAARPPILPQESTAKIATDSGNRYGLGLLVLVLGAGVAAVVLLRSEARRFFRRREHAAFSARLTRDRVDLGAEQDRQRAQVEPEQQYDDRRERAVGAAVVREVRGVHAEPGRDDHPQQRAGERPGCDQAEEAAASRALHAEPVQRTHAEHHHQREHRPTRDPGGIAPGGAEVVHEAGEHRDEEDHQAQEDHRAQREEQRLAPALHEALRLFLLRRDMEPGHERREAARRAPERDDERHRERDGDAGVVRARDRLQLELDEALHFVRKRAGEVVDLAADVARLGDEPVHGDDGDQRRHERQERVERDPCGYERQVVLPHPLGETPEHEEHFREPTLRHSLPLVVHQDAARATVDRRHALVAVDAE